VKAWINIPVIANGSIDSLASARLCIEQSNADGLMIGRAAAVSPWIFAVLARALYKVEISEPEVCLPLLYQKFVLALVERFQPDRRLGRLKEFTHYFAKNYFFGHHLASKVQASNSLKDAWLRAVEFFGENDPHGVDQLQSPFTSSVRGGAADCSTQSREPDISF
jgi:tRNA-dihydrouridine synthase